MENIKPKPPLEKRLSAYQRGLVEKWEVATKRKWIGEVHLTDEQVLKVVDIYFVMDLLKYTEKQTAVLEKLRSEMVALRHTLRPTGGTNEDTTSSDSALSQAQGVGAHQGQEG